MVYRRVLTDDRQGMATDDPKRALRITHVGRPIDTGGAFGRRFEPGPMTWSASCSCGWSAKGHGYAPVDAIKDEHEMHVLVHPAQP